MRFMACRVERHCAGCRHVQAIHAVAHRNLHGQIGAGNRMVRQAVALGTEDQRELVDMRRIFGRRVQTACRSSNEIERSSNAMATVVKPSDFNSSMPWNGQ